MSRWGHLEVRYETPAPRKMLALDGGGIRGVVSLEILLEIEQQLRIWLDGGADFRLCQYFDYIGGNSTGAIIATGLARGMAVSELLDFYTTYGEEMFDSTRLLARLNSLYRDQPLREMLQKTFGEDTDLSPEYLQCLLLVVTKNETTDSFWPLSSNPYAKYNDPDRPDCNLRIPLWQLVRASTAAPVYFPPEVIEWEKGNPEKSFVFVDGGMTPYNNPAFLLYRMATAPEYRLGWEKGEDKLLLVSVGTGSAASSGPEAKRAHRNLFSVIKGIPGALMYGAEVDQDINCRTFGRCVYGAPIDREVGDMIPRDESGEPIPLSTDLGREFLYARYNPDVSRESLLALGIDERDVEGVQKMDSVEHIEAMRVVGRATAREVSLSHLGPFV